MCNTSLVEDFKAIATRVGILIRHDTIAFDVYVTLDLRLLKAER
jgi:hypothetical protein